MTQTDKEYAKALFALGVEENKTEEYLRNLAQVQNLVEENPDYIEFLSSPAIPLSERLQAIDESFGNAFDEYSVSFLKLMCENGHFRFISSCIDEFAALVMEYNNRCTADIYSAVELDDNQKLAVITKLEKMTGKKIQPVYIIDKSLIGGLKIEIEGKTYDGSVKHRLRNVKDVISNEQT